ncbi:hypothetical protein A6456_09185 [Paraburkholderia tropica]|nr:hypothetical protein A6456_09185 [Paraburkholderia tropica]
MRDLILRAVRRFLKNRSVVHILRQILRDVALSFVMLVCILLIANQMLSAEMMSQILGQNVGSTSWTSHAQDVHFGERRFESPTYTASALN